MAQLTYSEAHIGHCLTRLLTLRRNSTVTVAATGDNRRKTGTRFAEEVLSLTQGLIRLGVEPGHVIAIAALNSDSYLVWLLAITCAGAIAAPLNYRWSLQEAKLAMDDVRPIMLVTDTTCNFWHSQFQDAIKWHVCMDHPAELDSFTDVLSTKSLKPCPLTSPSVSLLWAPHNAALICFTSGINFSQLPLPALFRAYSRTKDTTRSFETVTKILNGGGGLLPGLIEETVKVFPRAKLISAYGMTETCSSLTFMTLHNPTVSKCLQQPQTTKDSSLNSGHELAGFCVGRPAPHIELKIHVESSSHVGRILTRGPHLMLGYFGQPSMKVSYSVEGWFDTGDIGQIDDYGNLWLIGRSSGRIKSGGENVYPEEVESVLLQHPGISRVVVIGLPEYRLTEMVVACIQLEDNWQWLDLSSSCSANDKDHYLSTEIIQQFCREKNLTGFKIPKRYILRSTPFPTTGSGKVRRDQVKKEAMSSQQVLSSNL